LRNTAWLDEGSAAVITIITAGCLALIASSIGFALGLAREEVRLQMVADLSALAASDSRIGIIAGFPCPNAQEIASVNGANLLSCRIVGGVASVEVGENHLGFELSARAEAAPGE
jgi:secretion/DNA translocation related TadE-like protein